MRHRDRGSVTVEMALVLPIVVVLVGGGVMGVVLAAQKLDCLARARDTALAAARGEEVPAPGDGSPGSTSVEYHRDGTVVATVKTDLFECVQTAAVEP